ncbi:hypothetical protein N9L68_07325 [bacterium]|nr:hypothetical protein [bacterium]
MVDRWASPPRLRHPSRNKRETRVRHVKLNMLHDPTHGSANMLKGILRAWEGQQVANARETSRTVHEQWGYQCNRTEVQANGSLVSQITKTALVSCSFIIIISFIMIITIRIITIHISVIPIAPRIPPHHPSQIQEDRYDEFS